MAIECKLEDLVPGSSVPILVPWFFSPFWSVSASLGPISCEFPIRCLLCFPQLENP